MAIEPISSIMTAQAQGSVVQKPQASASSEKADVAAASQATQEAAKVDATVKAVENAQSKGNAQNETNKDATTASTEQLRKAVAQMRKSMTNEEAVFGFHDDTNRVTIKIVNKDTKEVIKELPAEKTLDMIARVWDMAGLLVDEKR